MSFALRAFAPHGRQQLARLPREATLLQQKRGMAGDDEPDHLFVNWWDNPYNPDLWHPYQKAWGGVVFWGVIAAVFLGRGGKKEPAAEAAKA